MSRMLSAGLALLALSSVAPAAQPRCTMSEAERAWVESALQAWQQVATGRLKLKPHREPIIVLFDARCRFEKVDGRSAWKSEPHNGSIRIPGGAEVPAQVTSFASSDSKSATPYFVMALPSVWQAAKVPISADLKGLTGVFLHEFSHTRQLEPLKPVFEAAEAKRKMDEDFNDDSLQGRFESDPAYVAVVEKEIALLFQAAAAADDAASRKLAAEALALMEARQKRWFVGEDSYWKNYDDLFLTMEGFGQWVAYAWLADPKGGKLEPAEALEKMRGRRRWWTQDQGLALFLVVDRLVPNWAEQAFDTPPKLGIDLLRVAVADAPARAGR